MRKGWVTVRLGDAATVIMGQAPSGASYNTAGEGLPFIQGSREFGAHFPSPEKFCSSPQKVAQPGDLLMSVRAPVGDMNWADQEIAIGRGLAILRAGSGMNQGFLKMALEHATSELMAASSSGMFASITKQGLANIEIAKPGLDEQLRMADLIAAVDEAIETAEVHCRRSADLRDELLSTLLSAVNERKLVGEVLDLDVRQVPVTADGVYPIVGILNRGRGLLVREAVTAKTTKYLKLNRVRPGQVVYSKLKAFEGAITVVPDTMTESYASPEFPTFTCKDGVLPGYLALLTSRREVWEQMALFSKGVGGRRERLHPRDFLNLSIKVPTLTDQQKIIELVGAADESTDAARETTAALKTLRSGLLAALLSGEHEISSTYDEVMSAAI